MNNSLKSKGLNRKKKVAKEAARGTGVSVKAARLATKMLKVRPEVHAMVVREQERINAGLLLDPAWNLEDIVHQAIMTWLQESQRLDYSFRERNDRFFESELARL